jgi:uncharacterized protein (DUF433 family)
VLANGCETATMNVKVLEREMYSEAEAARLLGVAQNTLNYWLEGVERRDKIYKPIIRIDPKGTRAPVTWAEFIEAGWLREYRQSHGVPMADLRTFIDAVRGRSNVAYPLAHYQPFVAGRELLRDAQDITGLDPDYCLVAEVRGQLVLTPPAATFFKRVDWKGDVATAYRPHDDERSPVRIDPELRFGKPSVRGVGTEVIWEHDQDGAAVDEIAEDFNLEVDDVRWALAYEFAQRAA